MAGSCSRCLAAGALLAAFGCAPHKRELDEPRAHDDATDDDAVDLSNGEFLDPHEDDVPDVEAAEPTPHAERDDDPEAQRRARPGAPTPRRTSRPIR